MQSLPEEYHKTIVFELRGEYGEYNPLPQLMIRWSEPETDEEYEKRVKDFKAAKALEKKRTEERERAEYARLAKKFGKLAKIKEETKPE